MTITRIPNWCLAVELILCFALPGRSSRAADALDFERHVAPFLANYCLDCHRPGKSSAGLSVATRQGLLDGGESGAAIRLENPAESLILRRMHDNQMPPKDAQHPRRRPAKAEIEQIETWIAGGANWPQNREIGLHEQTVDLDAARQFWSFQPVRQSVPPQVRHADRVANPIDAFIWQKLEAVGLELAPRASRRDLLRRVSLDLVGLPPDLSAQEQFLADTSPQAFARKVDRLLDDTAYGERWARHWLDLVRYADSNGYEHDHSKPNVWRYRDYVIDALNADKPYNRFLLEQLAGDELPDASESTRIATGFFALGPWLDEADPLVAAQIRADELDDLVQTTSQALLGMTLSCARCHNHKFDPLTMVDYYSLVAILAPLKHSQGNGDHDQPLGTPAQVRALRERDDRIGHLSSEIDKLKKAAGDQAGKIADLQQVIHQKKVEVPDLPRGYVLREDGPQPPPTHLLLAGRAANPGPLMQPRVPAVLTVSQPAFLPPDEHTSRRRLSLANWVIAPANPLTARVIVNRVWQHHFGIGLVATSSDFGDRGARPTHPELLDWLADWFVRDANWSLKKLHRLILTSETYQAGSAVTTTGRERDPENRLLAHFPLRRVDVEVIRDSILAVSGQLKIELHGPPVYLPIAKEVVEAHTDRGDAWRDSPPDQVKRRTIYAYIKRTLLVPMLEVLDLCDVNHTAERRITTSIAPQALTLYNGQFVNEQAAAFAERLLREAGTEPEPQIDLAYRLALARPPRPDELADLTGFLKAETAAQSDGTPRQSASEGQLRALTQLCRVIFNLNEFVYPN
ncbi:MAG: PSD1 domain-containing protein [Planctomycetes bacterium]|nr:PSD1 domain-containing protein [Planctomycetota bacterium]